MENGLGKGTEVDVRRKVQTGFGRTVLFVKGHISLD